MKYVIERVIINKNDSEREIRNKIAKRLSLSPESFRYEIVRRNLDIVEDEAVYYVKAIVDTNSFIRDTRIGFFGPSESLIIQPKKSRNRPIVVGAGLAGLFAAYVLARAGLRPIVVEQGCGSSARDENISHFEQGNPNIASSYGSGLGGFSGWCGGVSFSNRLDGYGQFALDTFLNFGASENMSYEGTFYISSGEMREIVNKIVAEIKNLGGEVHLNAKMTAILHSFGKVKGIQTSKTDGKKETIKGKYVVLANGLINTSLLNVLSKAKVKTEPKPFYMGVIAEIPAKDANAAVYGNEASRSGLPPFYFSKDFKTSSGRKAKVGYLYPNGRVFCDAPNGSQILLRSAFPNSNTNNYSVSILVEVEPNEFQNFGDDGVSPFLKNFYGSLYSQASPAYAPCETLKDFISEGNPVKLGNAKASYYPGVYLEDIASTSPSFLEKDLVEAVTIFSKNFPGVKPNDVTVFGFTDGRSSPFKVCADEDCNTSLKGLFSALPSSQKEESILDEARRGVICAFSLLNQD